MAKTVPLQKVKACKPGGGQLYWRKEGANQTFKAGDLLVLSSGKLTKCATKPTDISYLALADATGVTNTLLPVLSLENQPLVMNLYHTTAASAVYADTLAGTTANIIRTNTGNFHVDLENTDAKACIILGKADFDNAADIYCRVEVYILSDILTVGQREKTP